MAGADVIPLPEDIREKASQLQLDLDNVGKTVATTQVASDPFDGVPGWIGESADAYTESIQKLGEHVRTLSGQFAPAVTAVENWSTAVGTAIDTTVPNLRLEYDGAQTSYEDSIDSLNQEIENKKGTAQAYTSYEISSMRANLTEIRDEAQREIMDRYRTAMDNLDQEAQNAANAIQSAQDAVVAPSSASTRDQVGSTLFNDIPLVDGQAEWEYAQEVAPAAAHIINKPNPTPDDIRKFVTKYGSMCEHPFFAQALAECCTPEQITQFLMDAEVLRGSLTDKDGNLDTAYDETLNTLVRGLGSTIVLSTGGMNADPSMTQEQDAFFAAQAGLRTRDGSTIDDLISTRLAQWKTTGNTLYNTTGEPASADEPYFGGDYGQHYGYEYMAAMMSNAANANPNLALGPEFLEGSGSVAHDIVAFDHAHGKDIALTGGYGNNWGALGKPPGGDRNATDPLEALFKLMDEPASFSDGTLPEDSPSRARLGAGNQERFDAVQAFLTDGTTFNVNAADEAARVPPFTDNGPMNMTRYLTGFRGAGPDHPATQDNGDSLGRLLAQAAVPEDPPAGAERGTPEYEAWHEHNRRSAEIAGNYLLGYQEGLEINDDSYNGQDGFGMQHAALRSWAGTILGGYVDGITDSFVTPANESTNFSVDVPQGNDGHRLTLSQDLANRILGKGGGGNGLFTDLAFDAAVNDNGTPDDLSDDLNVYGRSTALATLTASSMAGYQEDMSSALASHDYSGLERAQQKWAHILNAITASPTQADGEVGAVVDASNAQLKSMVERGLGMIPFGKIIGEGHDAATWMIDQTKSNIVPPTLDALLSENNHNNAMKGQVSSHQVLEMAMQDAMFQAISTGDYWGDPPITPQEFIAEHGDMKSFLRPDNSVIPYSEMDTNQREAFRQYVTGTDGLGSYTQSTRNGIMSSLNDAETERQEALNDD